MLKIKSILGQISSTGTFRDSSITTSATIVNGALGVVFYILLARSLGPSDYGLFVVAVSALTLMADIGNLGTDTGLIRFIGKYINGDSIVPKRFLKLALEVKLIVWVLVLVTILPMVSFLAMKVFGKPELTVPLRYAVLGVGGAMLFSFTTNALQAYQRFVSWSVLNIASNTLRLILVGLLIYLAGVNLESSLLVYLLIPFLGFLVGLMILPNFWVKGEREVAKEFFHYNKWVALLTLVAAVSARLDIFLAARLLSSAQLGVYSAASQLTSVVPQLLFAIATVVAPKLASLDSDIKAIAYLKKLQLMVVVLAILGLIVSPVSVFVIPLLFGQAYVGSVGLFLILFLAQLVFLISLPVHQAVFYYFGKPSVFVFISVVHLLIISSLGWVLTLQFGVYGMAVAVLVGMISNFVLPLIWVVAKFKQR